MTTAATSDDISVRQVRLPVPAGGRHERGGLRWQVVIASPRDEWERTYGRVRFERKRDAIDMVQRIERHRAATGAL